MWFTHLSRGECVAVYFLHTTLEGSVCSRIIVIVIVTITTIIRIIVVIVAVVVDVVVIVVVGMAVGLVVVGMIVGGSASVCHCRVSSVGR